MHNDLLLLWTPVFVPYAGQTVGKRSYENKTESFHSKSKVDVSETPVR